MQKSAPLANKLLLCLLFFALISKSNAGKCGNGMKTGDEQCDDGNLLSGDGCSSTCTVERLFKCTTPNKISVCKNSCMDGILEKTIGEVCDDGDSNNANGCANDCTITTGWKCSNIDGQKSVCSEICGDGVFAGKQKLAQNCDDGNTLNGDGCSSTCAVQAGYECLAGRVPYCQKMERCGNGKYEPSIGQLCDDGDLDNENGCNTTCQITNSSFKCENALQQKSICYFDCRIPAQTTTLNQETISNHQNLVKPQTCFLDLDGKQVCFNDCLDIYYHKTVISSGEYLNSYYNDKLYCNDHNLVSGDGCSECQLDAGVNSTKLSLLEEKNESYYIEYGRISYIHNCGNQIVDDNQDTDIPLYPQSKKNCSIFCPFTKSVCGNLILENEEQCDSLVGCNDDCSGPLNENFECNYQFDKSVNNKFVTVIPISICHDIRIKTWAEELIKYYLKFSKQEQLGFYNFSMAQIKQLYVQNSADFSYLENKPHLYTAPRLLYYLASSLISNGAISIRYNANVENMGRFVENVIAKTLTEQPNPIAVASYGQSWETA